MSDKPPLTSTWQAPSNLAIVKYWGKKGIQEPVNPSISFSLSRANTTTKVNLIEKKGGSFSFNLGQKAAPGFENKIQSFLNAIKARLPIVANYYFDIEAQILFPIVLA